MSYFASELSLINYRVILVAPMIKQALSLCEQFAVELTTDISSPQQKLNLVNYAPKEISVNSFVSWTSATLGMRAGSQVRIHLVSFALENGMLSQNVFEMADAFIFYNPESDPMSERFLRLSTNAEHRKKPSILINPEQTSSEEKFRQKAIQLWMERNFSFALDLKPEGQTFERVLDWIMIN